MGLLSRWSSKRDEDDIGRVPGFLKPAGPRMSKFKQFLRNELNFYRIHVLVFVFTPLIASAIFYASNGSTHIDYIDCLFVCVTAITVTGLTTINVSTATGWQQAILFCLMLIGNIIAVSITMIWVRRHFFRKKFEAVIRSNAAARKRAHDIEEAHHLERRKNLIRLRRKLGLRGRAHHHARKHNPHRPSSTSPDGNDELDDKDSRSPNGPSPGLSSTDTSSTDRIAEAELKAEREREREAAKKKKNKKGPLRADMIKRIDQPAVLINPMGMPSEGHPAPAPAEETTDAQAAATNGSGGILNQPNGTPALGSDTNDAADNSNQPSIRISLPNERTPQRTSALNFFGDVPVTASPANLSWSEDRGTTTDPLTASAPEHERGLARTARLVAEPEAADDDNAVADESVLAPLPSRTSNHLSRITAESFASPSVNRRRRTSDPTGADRTHSRRGSESGLNTRFGATGDADHSASLRPADEDRMPRSQTIQYAEPPRIRPQDRIGSTARPDRGYTTGVFPKAPTGQFSVPRQRTFERTPTQYSAGYRGLPLTKTMTSAKDRGFGGFPTPLELAGKGLSKAFPKARDRFVRSTTMQRSATIASTHSFTRNETEGQRSAPYLSFDVNVYGNSLFHSLTEAQRDELGGVEYRALDFLAKMVPIYWFTICFFCIVLVAPYLASPAFDKYRPVFEAQGSAAPNTTWFWFFQVVSAITNTGLSLIDTSMINMADAYLLLIPMAFLILVGNTAFPIFLRFWIWIYSRCVSKTSRHYETVRFILDHPRRCFVYLFPSGQTWFLFGILAFLNCFDWVAFQILDIGSPDIESIPVPQRIFDGLFQSIAVRAAGFQVVGLLGVAPAVQFLYVIMMYISAYPLALSVRSTNVYEERSLGVYTEKKEEQEEEMPAQISSTTGWGTYLAAHARRQLAFDIWWLGFALWLVCIIERAQITDPATNSWFTVFSCLFELTSAYGTVGLSTGTPTDSFSLSGRFKTLSKLVVIATMLRGRHRGLPVAIDRSILLPGDLEEQDAATEAWSVVDPDARGGALSGIGAGSLYRDTSMDGPRTGASSFTRVATQPFSFNSAGVLDRQDAEGNPGRRSASDGDVQARGGGEDGEVYGGGADVMRTISPSSTGSHQASRNIFGSSAAEGQQSTGSYAHAHAHHHSNIVGPAEAFQLDPIEENREGVATPMEQPEHDPLSSAAMLLAGGAKSPKGKGRRESVDKEAARGDEERLAEMYGSAAPHLVGSRERSEAGRA